MANTVSTSSCSTLKEKCIISFKIFATNFTGLTPASTATSGRFIYYPGCNDIKNRITYYTINAVVYNTSTTGSSVGSTNVQTLISATEVIRSNITKLFYVATTKNITITTAPSTFVLEKLVVLLRSPTSVDYGRAFTPNLPTTRTTLSNGNSYKIRLAKGYYFASFTSTSTINET